jgi:cellulose synthase/poly-beta-1,6-N-acetylglucosamine synthase-like glycosyltransferase
MWSGPGAATLIFVIGAFLAVAPALPHDRTWARSLMALCGSALLLRYLAWRLNATFEMEGLGWAGQLWVWTCLIAELLLIVDNFLSLLVMARWADRSHEADDHAARLRSTPASELPTVDVLIPTYDEDLEVLERTIVGAKSIDYPKTRVWVLDDGRRDWLEEFCARKGVGYLRRPDNRHAKAGNINHALGLTDGEFVAIFDADFVPHRDFLYRTLGFFADPRIGIVQTPQRFFNPDPVQLNLGAPRLFPDEQRFFFDRVLPSRDAWDAAFCCGSNCVIRRAALELIGGIPTGSVTEDVLTTLALLRHGYVTRYLNEKLALGLSAESLKAFFVQRQRWCRGGVQLLFLRDGPLGPGLDLMKRLLFFPIYWLVQLPATLLLALMPIVYLWTGVPPLHVASLDDFLGYQLATLLFFVLTFAWLAPRSFVPVLTTAIHMFMAIRLVPTALATLIKPFGEPFRVTPKGAAGRRSASDGTTAGVALFLLLACLGGALRVPLGYLVGHQHRLAEVAVACALFESVLLLIVLVLSVDRERPRAQDRFPLVGELMATPFAAAVRARLGELSLAGATLAFDGPPALAMARALRIEIDGLGVAHGETKWINETRAGVQWTWLDEGLNKRLTERYPELAAHRRDQSRRHPRVEVDLPVRVQLLGTSGMAGRTRNVSLSGAMLGLPDDVSARLGCHLRLEFQAIGTIDALIVRRSAAGTAVRFTGMEEGTWEQLIRHLYTMGLEQESDASAGFARRSTTILNRLVGTS